MSFEGLLSDFSAIDVVQMLHAARKTGVLSLFTDDAEAKLVFKDGAIIGSKHPNKGTHIGKMLVDSGIAVGALIPQRMTLEDFFIEVTGSTGEQIE